MIKEEDILEFGFEKVDEEIPFHPYRKNLSDVVDGAAIALIITLERNTQEFALLLPDSSQIFLSIGDLEQLRTFEKSIESWEPRF